MITPELVFGTKDNINGWQECARALVLLPYGLFLIRLVGRRIFGKWSAVDFIVAIIIGSALGRVLTGSAPLGATLAACTFMMVLHWALVRLASRHRLFSRLVEGSPITLAKAGELDERAMLSNNITKADLHEAMRTVSVEKVGDTKLVTLEPSGKITVVKQSS